VHPVKKAEGTLLPKLDTFLSGETVPHSQKLADSWDRLTSHFGSTASTFFFREAVFHLLFKPINSGRRRFHPPSALILRDWNSLPTGCERAHAVLGEWNENAVRSTREGGSRKRFVRPNQKLVSGYRKWGKWKERERSEIDDGEERARERKRVGGARLKGGGRRTKKRHDRQLICTYIRHPRGSPIQLSALIYNVRRLCHRIVPIYTIPHVAIGSAFGCAFLWNLLSWTGKLLGWKNVIHGTKEIASRFSHRPTIAVCQAWSLVL